MSLDNRVFTINCVVHCKELGICKLYPLALDPNCEENSKKFAEKLKKTHPDAVIEWFKTVSVTYGGVYE